MEALELADWRRRVAELYAAARAGGPGEGTWQRWRQGRDDLFAHHPQTPVPPERRPAYGSAGMRFFPYDPAWRITAEVRPIEGPVAAVGHSGEGSTPLRPVGQLAVPGGVLTLLWLEGYGGGLFLPFRDATSGEETYGGGRYLLDTVKGADLGGHDGVLVLDFNYAYHPSCAHDGRWSCPLAPPENRFDVAVRAGELLPGT